MNVHHEDETELTFSVTDPAILVNAQLNGLDANPGPDRTPGKQQQLTAKPLSQGVFNSPATLQNATPGGRTAYEPLPGNSRRANQPEAKISWKHFLGGSRA